MFMGCLFNLQFLASLESTVCVSYWYGGIFKNNTDFLKADFSYIEIVQAIDSQKLFAFRLALKAFTVCRPTKCTQLFNW